MTRGGGKAAMLQANDEGAEGMLRRCIVSGVSKSPEQMVRFVVGPDMQIVPDVVQKLPGRGYWVTAERDVITRAVERAQFSKAAKCAVKCPDDLPGLVERLLVQRCVDLLGLARRAGQAITGFSQVEPALREQAGRIAALVEASGSGGADRGKLVTYARKRGSVRIIGCLSESEIGLAFGRENVVHAALARGPLAERFIAEADRLGGFRVLCPPEWDVA